MNGTRAARKLRSLLLFAAFAASAHTLRVEKFTCPNDGTQFEATMDASGTSWGRRLDLKPEGAIAAPSRVPVCPVCHLPLINGLRKEEVEKLRPLLASAEYQQDAKDHPSYFLVAAVLESLGKPPATVGYAYLQASWQCDGKPELYREALERTLPRIEQSNKPDFRFLRGELLRQLERFDEATQHFRSLMADPSFAQPPWPSLIARELKLLAAKDRMPHQAQPTRGQQPFSFAHNPIAHVTPGAAIFPERTPLLPGLDGLAFPHELDGKLGARAGRAL